MYINFYIYYMIHSIVYKWDFFHITDMEGDEIFNILEVGNAYF